MSTAPKYARLNTNNKWSNSKRYSNDKFSSQQYEDVNQVGITIKNQLNWWDDFKGDYTDLSRDYTATSGVTQGGTFLYMETTNVLNNFQYMYFNPFFQGFTDGSYYEDIRIASSFYFDELTNQVFEHNLITNDNNNSGVWANHSLATPTLRTNRFALTLAYDTAADGTLVLLFGNNNAAFNANSPAGVAFATAVDTGITPTVFVEVYYELILRPNGTFMIKILDTADGTRFEYSGSFMKYLSGTTLYTSYHLITLAAAKKYAYVDFLGINALADNDERDVF